MVSFILLFLLTNPWVVGVCGAPCTGSMLLFALTEAGHPVVFQFVFVVQMHFFGKTPLPK